ncbi:helix-turn-helix transcriptional regulator [Brucella cytisi]|uniref:DNA-binding protein n=1 Tax=Brucella cytisi TaxID=407152 RepID=A0A1J6HG34_9HYPH|nr:helix-turn-helix domain-containing protein [Brucella cytisi]NKC50443.1 helix-turn-helix domain-containing protein [Brucella cytisi]OIS91949.1 DNA-binding protein [Brucella cytisi]
MEVTSDNDNDRDLLMGADAIAKFLGITRRQTYRLIYDGLMPSFKLGRGPKATVAARRSSLRNWMAEQEARAA